MKNKNAVFLFSASALVGSFAQGGRAQTTVNNIDATVTTGEVYDFNLDGDGTTNFAVRFDGEKLHGLNHLDKNSFPFVSGRTQDTTDAAETTYVLGNVDAGQSGAVGFPLAGPGTTIGPGYLTAAGVGYLYQDYNGNTAGGWSSTSVSDGYVGLEFVSDGGAVTNFGWVELEFDYNGGTDSTIEIMRDAFDATPNDSLITPASAPEPSAAALTGLVGACAALRLRGRSSRLTN